MKNMLKLIIEAIKIYVDKKVDFDELKILQETNTVDILSDTNGNILTDSNGKIYTL